MSLENNNQSTEDGLIKPNYTTYGKVFVGKYMLAIAVITIIVFIKIPWGQANQIYWFKDFTDFVSIYSINLTTITKHNNAFPEFSISFLACMNFVGPIYVMFGLLFAVKHVLVLKNENINIAANTGFSRYLFELILLSLFFMAMLWGVLIFTGESSAYPFRINTSKYLFVFYYTMSWFVVAMLGFIVTARFLILVFTLKE